MSRQYHRFILCCQTVISIDLPDSAIPLTPSMIPKNTHYLFHIKLLVRTCAKFSKWPNPTKQRRKQFVTLADDVCSGNASLLQPTPSRARLEEKFPFHGFAACKECFRIVKGPWTSSLAAANFAGVVIQEPPLNVFAGSFVEFAGCEALENIGVVGHGDVPNGEGGIRTHGTLRPSGFQDRRDSPLCHLSKIYCWLGFSRRRLPLHGWRQGTTCRAVHRPTSGKTGAIVHSATSPET